MPKKELNGKRLPLPPEYGHTNYYDPMTNIRMTGSFYRNLKDSPLAIRGCCAVMFLIGPAVVMLVLIISEIPRIKDWFSLIIMLVISLFLLLVGTRIIIGKKPEKGKAPAGNKKNPKSRSLQQ